MRSHPHFNNAEILPLLAYAFTYAPTLLASQGPNPKFLDFPFAKLGIAVTMTGPTNTHSTTTRDNSPFSDLPSSRNLVYKYDQVTLIPNSNHSGMGFTDQLASKSGVSG
ncbi:hypothetical protein KEM48_002106 [Puccinia striiformis f. sp. tritici PST-130]|nr:hypothetical protein KEM48_002106 [Puccinia striiformis f. sp. tritici PST-130]